jgi:hypothetical protein
MSQCEKFRATVLKIPKVISWDSPVFNPTATLDQIEEVRAGRGVEGLSPESDAVIFFSSG